MTTFVVQAILAALVLGIVGAVSIALGQPLLVPSLGTAVLLQVHFPNLPSARPWNTAVGQFCGVICGFAASYLLGAAADPSFSGTHPLLTSRVAATMLAIAATLLLQTVLKAARPAGGATTLIATLGAESADWTGFGRFIDAILLLTAIGEGARRIVLRIGRQAVRGSETRHVRYAGSVLQTSLDRIGGAERQPSVRKHRLASSILPAFGSEPSPPASRLMMLHD